MRSIPVGRKLCNGKLSLLKNFLEKKHLQNQGFKIQKAFYLKVECCDITFSEIFRSFQAEYTLRFQVVYKMTKAKDSLKLHTYKLLKVCNLFFLKSKIITPKYENQIVRDFFFQKRTIKKLKT